MLIAQAPAPGDSGGSAFRSTAGKRGAILVFSYAFPPMQTQMTPVVVKPMAALSRMGYSVDVLCAEPFSEYLGRDDSLLPYTDEHFESIVRLPPPADWLAGKRRSKLQSAMPDLMWAHGRRALTALTGMDLARYDAVITWSPFHSINPVMAGIKKRHPGVRWIAQFSDPWAANPLERRTLARIWSFWHEPRAIRAADFLVHSSSHSLELMLHRRPDLRTKCAVIPHPFDPQLFPRRPKASNSRITLRYVGVLFGRRSPETLFAALSTLLARAPHLAERLHLELIGHVPAEMLQSPAALALPEGMVTHVPNVSYVESLEKMYDADILILIEADIKENLFVPSKLSDYIGAGTPIVGITPPGGAEEVLRRLGSWQARPGDVEGIARALTGALQYVTNRSTDPWCDQTFRETFSAGHVAGRFARILEQRNGS
jgi:glycosyltransferase involved in cell wall biosynthesis